jgi:hypothetical protein
VLDTLVGDRPLEHGPAGLRSVPVASCADLLAYLLEGPDTLPPPFAQHVEDVVGRQFASPPVVFLLLGGAVVGVAQV